MAGDVSEPTPSPEMQAAAEAARAYALACGEVIEATNACVEIVNRAVGARKMAAKRPQHEISIRNFTTMAERAEQEFVAPYKTFVAAVNAAKAAAERLRGAQSSVDPELLLLTALADDLYNPTGVAIHILRTTFGATPATFAQGLEEANAAIQGDVFGFGEDGFGGHVYAPPESDGKDCPWCAERIKAAAIICRFCGRDVNTAPGAVPSA